jgi:hypothetical protein
MIVRSLRLTIESALPGGRLQSITRREYGCRMTHASSASPNPDATAPAPISHAM